MPNRSATRDKCTVTMRGAAQSRRGRVVGRGKGRAVVSRVWRIRRSSRRGKHTRGCAKRKKQSMEHLYKWKVIDQGIYHVKQLVTISENVITTPLADSDLQPTHAQFTEHEGPNVSSTCHTPMDYFSLFFSDNLLQYITEQTNLYARKRIVAMQVLLTVFS